MLFDGYTRSHRPTGVSYYKIEASNNEGHILIECHHDNIRVVRNTLTEMG